MRSVGGPSGGDVLIGVIQELDVRTGRILFEWRSIDHVALDESYIAEITSPYDYFHINSVALTPDGHMLISARNTCAIYKISRASGEVIWRLGGKKSDFAMGARTRFGYQHDARLHADSTQLSLFDNGPVPGSDARPQSRGLVLNLDVRRMRATIAREHRHDPPVFAFATGNAQILPNEGHARRLGHHRPLQPVRRGNLRCPPSPISPTSRTPDGSSPKRCASTRRRGSLAGERSTRTRSANSRSPRAASSS